MKFFKKIGRPTDEEQMLIDAICNLAKEKGLSLDQLPECSNIDDLMQVVDLIEQNKIHEPTPEPENVNEEISTVEEETIAATEDYPPEEPEEELTESFDQETEQVTEQQDTFLENDLPDFEGSDYDPFAEKIVERSYNQLGEDKKKNGEDVEQETELEESSTPLDDLNPQTKRKAAEKTADAILKGYKHLAPEPFKWWCKFPESKIEQLTFEGELDTSIEVQPGLSFDEYIKQTNTQIDEIFEVQEETLEEIKEPLVEVLMEQELELTPQQRLGMAVLSHLLQMFTMAMKLWGQNKRILEYQKHLTELAYNARANTA